MSSFTPWLTGVRLTLPNATWSDRSTLTLAGPAAPGGLPPSISLARDERRSAPPGEPFGAYVRRQIDQLAAQLPGFNPRLPTPLWPGSGESRDALFSWRCGSHDLTQWVVWRSLPDGTVITFTATCASDRFDDCRPTFENALHGLSIDAEAFAADPA